MKADELKKLYIDFFVNKGHKLLPNASLVPENDPTALFTSAGMHPLVSSLLGEKHPLGKRLVSVQRCLRTQDIDEVGDEGHLTFFEMLGNWSLGDYWKKESIGFSWEFITKKLKLSPERIFVTCFAGDEDAPKDMEAFDAWREIGVSQTHIFFLGKKDNWWAVGKTGPCGPDTEIFYDTGKKACGKECKPGCNCGKYVEFWNNVFMEFNRLEDNSLKRLSQKSVDTGMGVERTTALLQGKSDVFETELFLPIIKKIETLSGFSYKQHKMEIRIIADHARACVLAIADGVYPSNVEAGHIVRRLIRRSVIESRKISISSPFLSELAKTIVNEYKSNYPFLVKRQEDILQILKLEEEKFALALKNGEKWFTKTVRKFSQANPGEKIFPAANVVAGTATFGLPESYLRERLSEEGYKVVEKEIQEEKESHKKQSSKGQEKRFKGGLSDDSEEVVAYHTVTHLLHQALRDLLGKVVRQAGSNITSERLRFDFVFGRKLTQEEIKKIEDVVNGKIAENLPVRVEEMSLEKAQRSGALAFFTQKYSGRVKVYSIGNFSKEVCGGPHVQSTGEIGKIKIIKQKTIAQDRQRLYLKFANGS